MRPGLGSGRGANARRSHRNGVARRHRPTDPSRRPDGPLTRRPCPSRSGTVFSNTGVAGRLYQTVPLSHLGLLPPAQSGIAGTKQSNVAAKPGSRPAPKRVSPRNPDRKEGDSCTQPILPKTPRPTVSGAPATGLQKNAKPSGNEPQRETAHGRQRIPVGSACPNCSRSYPGARLPTLIGPKREMRFPIPYQVAPHLSQTGSKTQAALNSI